MSSNTTPSLVSANTMGGETDANATLTDFVHIPADTDAKSMAQPSDKALQSAAEYCVLKAKLLDEINLIRATMGLPSWGITSFDLPTLEDRVCYFKQKQELIQFIRPLQEELQVPVESVSFLANVSNESLKHQFDGLQGKMLTKIVLEEKREIIRKIESIQFNMDMPRYDHYLSQWTIEDLKRNLGELQKQEKDDKELRDVLADKVFALQKDLKTYTLNEEQGKINCSKAGPLQKQLDGLHEEKEKRMAMIRDIRELQLQLGDTALSSMEYMLGRFLSVLEDEKHELVKNLADKKAAEAKVEPTPSTPTPETVQQIPALNKKEIQAKGNLSFNLIKEAFVDIQSIIVETNNLYLKLEVLHKKWQATPWSKDAESIKKKMELVTEKLAHFYEYLSVFREDVNVARTENLVECHEGVVKPRVRYQVISKTDGKITWHGCHSFKELAEQEAATIHENVVSVVTVKLA